MKVLLLSYKDYAGSGYRLYRALKRYTVHDVDMRVGLVKNRFAIEGCGDRIGADTQRLIDNADVVHLKGDWPHGYYTRKYGFSFTGKKIIQTVSGSFFRKKDHPPGYGMGKFKPDQYRDCWFRSSMEPDLLYPEYEGVWTPYSIDCQFVPNKWELRTPPVFVHFPSDRTVKNTGFVEEVLSGLSRHIEIKTYIPDRPISHQSVAREMIGATIYMDQFGVGAYGNAAVEAMQYGIPVAAWLSDEFFAQGPDVLKHCPVITAPMDVDAWVKRLLSVFEGELPTLSYRTKAWCNKIHNSQVVANTWDKIYRYGRV